MTDERLKKGQELKKQVDKVSGNVKQYDHIIPQTKKGFLNIEISTGSDTINISAPNALERRLILNLLKNLRKNEQKNLDALTKEFESL